MVSSLSMAFMVVTLLIAMLVPVGGVVWIAVRRQPDRSRRWPRVWRAFGAGALAFVASQVLTRIPLMTLVVPQLPESISSFLLSGPVASFTAGLFEETGRLVVMLLLLKAFHRWIDGVSFGLGHGGIEAALIVGLASVNNLVLSVLINTGQWGTIASSISPEQSEQLRGLLVDTPPAHFLLAGAERLSAMTLHIACSLLVLAGIVLGRKLLLWAAAVLLHGSFNLVAVTLVGAGIDLVLVEVVLAAIAVALWVGIVKAKPIYPTVMGTSEVAPTPGIA